MEKVSKILLQQRIRNNAMDYFDVSFKEIAKWGAFEIINMWDDIFPSGLDDEWVSEPVFSQKEQNSIKAFCSLVSQIARLTKEDIFSESELIDIPEWINFIKLANECLTTFEIRGRLSNDIEEF